MTKTISLPPVLRVLLSVMVEDLRSCHDFQDVREVLTSEHDLYEDQILSLAGQLEYWIREATTRSRGYYFAIDRIEAVKELILLIREKLQTK